MSSCHLCRQCQHNPEAPQKQLDKMSQKYYNMFMIYKNLFDDISSTSNYDKINRFLRPLYDYLGINHFWWYMLTSSGEYAYFGSHMKWSEFCFEKDLHLTFPCLRHPNVVQHGIHLMKASNEKSYQEVLDIAWKKFQINFNINLVKKNNGAIEAFGFATRFNDVKADERMINEIPLLRAFCEAFKKKFEVIFELAKEQQVCIASPMGQAFYELPRRHIVPGCRDDILKVLGLKNFLLLTSREKEILSYVRNGFPVGFIASKLALSKRTVENYMTNLKDKLLCDSKTDLIEKSIALDAIGLLQ